MKPISLSIDKLVWKNRKAKKSKEHRKKGWKRKVKKEVSDERGK
jgi:hypothetical protein